MPRRCCVPGCKSNYDTDIKIKGTVSVFKFPKDENLKLSWNKVIPRKDWTPSIYSAVCKLHFHDSDFYYSNDASKQLRIKPDAVPSVFHNLPKYISKSEAPKRNDPSIRKEKYYTRIEQMSNDFLARDIISSFQDFSNNFEKKLNLKDWYIFKSRLQIVLFRIEDNDYKGCNFQVKLIIKESMEVKIFHKESPVSFNNVSFILPSNLKLTLWSQIENLLSHFKMEQEPVPDRKTYIKLASTYLKKAKEIDNDEDEHAHEISGKLDLLSNQVELLLSKQPRYEPSTIVMAFIIYSHSASTYNKLRNFMALPSKSYLQKISSSFHISPNYKNNNDEHYINHVSRNMNERERYVALLIDEIYINTELQYKSNNLFGMAQNNVIQPARTVLAFMIKSTYGSFKEIVRLVPVSHPTGNDLHIMTTEVIDFVQNLNFKVNVIITDNNKINQNLFKTLCSNDICFTNPKFPDSVIYVQYDTVHIFKNIRNNWLNVLTTDQTFNYPDMETNEIKMACFNHFREIYDKESNLIVKQAHKLNSKTLSPNNLERQNVKLVDNVFHHSTIAALRSHGGKYIQTAEFCEMIRHWWDIVNTRSVYNGMHKRNSWSNPFYDFSDERLSFLEKFISCLSIWRDSSKNNNIGVLSKDTFDAAILSTKTIISFIKHSFSLPDVQYVLVGKLQTDNLEARFRLYRSLSGCNYRVSYSEIIDCEKKIRIRNIFKHNPSDFKSLSVGVSENAFTEVDVSNFESILESDYLKDACIDEPALLYVAGYAANAVAKTTNCNSCKNLIYEDKGNYSNFEYFNILQMGGLVTSTSHVKFLLFHMNAIFQYILKMEDLKILFFSSDQHKSILTFLTLASLDREKFQIDFNRKCQCTVISRILHLKICLRFSNIFLNNYVKDVRDKNEKYNERKLMNFK